MADLGRVEIEKTDLGTLMGELAARVRSDALAVAGLAFRHSDPGTVEHRDLLTLTASLERTAMLIEAVEERLCRDCRLLDVVNYITFGTVPTVERRHHRRGRSKR